MTNGLIKILALSGLILANGCSDKDPSMFAAFDDSTTPNKPSVMPKYYDDNIFDAPYTPTNQPTRGLE